MKVLMIFVNLILKNQVLYHNGKFKKNGYIVGKYFIVLNNKVKQNPIIMKILNLNFMEL